MANFELAFHRLMQDEGVVLTNDPTDRGGLTYAGISRKFHPGWAGWKFIDAGDTPPTQLVRDFYHVTFWMPVQGDKLPNQQVAEVLGVDLPKAENSYNTSSKIDQSWTEFVKE